MAPLQNRVSFRTIISWASIGLAILLIVGYALSRTSGALFGPSITLLSPEDGATTSPYVIVRGESKRVFELRINGRVVPTTPTGEFQETVGISSGYNVITVSGLDRLGKTTTISRTLVREEP